MSMTTSRNSTGVNRFKDLLNHWTTDATGVSRASIKRLRKKKVDIGGGVFLTPTKRCKHSRCLLVHDFDCEAIRWKIYHLYQSKERVTFSKLLVVLKEDNIFHCQRSTLHILLREMGFKWVTITFVMMPINIVLYRHKRVDNRVNGWVRHSNWRWIRWVWWFGSIWWVWWWIVLGILSLPFLFKHAFQNHSGFIAALNRNRQYLIIILIVIIVIKEHLFI